MNDVISRSAAIADLKEWLYRKPVDEYESGFNEGLSGAIERIGNGNINPNLDVAPVVRCKDCRSSRMLSIKEMITFEPYCLVCRYPHGAGVSYPEYDMTERVVAPNDYCSYGRLRTNGR